MLIADADIDPNTVAITETGKGPQKTAPIQGFLLYLQVTASPGSPLPIPAALWERDARHSRSVLWLEKGTCWSMQAAETLGRGLLEQRDGQEEESGVGGSLKCYLPLCSHTVEDMLTLTSTFSCKAKLLSFFFPSTALIAGILQAILVEQPSISEPLLQLILVLFPLLN